MIYPLDIFLHTLPTSELIPWPPSTLRLPAEAQRCGTAGHPGAARLVALRRQAAEELFGTSPWCRSGRSVT